ncbi:hypothetical protein GMPD_38310 [Geomonas paludis]|uniref:Uncharacterized protein n=1 Tax=Geomonas paludis TaxID=2740185 RepID=A0A6V8N0E0_9BACT|nr:hypothetical protein GMPD_38310 [Geomonas paludis]
MSWILMGHLPKQLNVKAAPPSITQDGLTQSRKATVFSVKQKRGYRSKAGYL